MQRTFRLILVVVIVALACSAGAWYWHGHRSDKASFRTASIRTGDLTATITATGTVEPVERVDVGAQVAGLLVEFGKDTHGNTIDYGSEVEEGGLLAKIDTNLYASDVATGKAQVDQDIAAEKNAVANIEQMRAKAVEAEADWTRAEKLGPSEALAPTTYDSYKANNEIAKANVDLAVAALEEAKATTAQAQAALHKSQIELDYCIITSPVKGVIIDRRVNIGETVVSSLNTPSLFLIAKDLRHIQVWASVNEADIGNIHPGQPVLFGVDAYPNRVFKGSVNKIRLNATMTQNVVTYTVEVNAENDDMKLLPYLTANIRFLTGERQNVLLAPNSALRWRPQQDLIDPNFRQPAAGGGGHHGGRGGSETPTQQSGNLWVESGAYVRPIPVNLGLTDGTSTEVTGEGVTDGMVVIVGNKTEETASADVPGANPFIPQLGRRTPPARADGSPGGAGGPGGGGGAGRRGNSP